MPCSDGLALDQFLADRTLNEAQDALAQSTKEVSKLTELLCFAMHVIEREREIFNSKFPNHSVDMFGFLEPEDYDDYGSIPNATCLKLASQLNDWWEEHQKEDEKRLKILKKEALSKLTDEEKLVLGLTNDEDEA